MGAYPSTQPPHPTGTPMYCLPTGFPWLPAPVDDGGISCSPAAITSRNRASRAATRRATTHSSAAAAAPGSPARMTPRPRVLGHRQPRTRLRRLGSAGHEPLHLIGRGLRSRRRTPFALTSNFYMHACNFYRKTPRVSHSKGPARTRRIAISGVRRRSSQESLERRSSGMPIALAE